MGVGGVEKENWRGKKEPSPAPSPRPLVSPWSLGGVEGKLAGNKGPSPAPCPWFHLGEEFKEKIGGKTGAKPRPVPLGPTLHSRQ